MSEDKGRGDRIWEGRVKRVGRRLDERVDDGRPTSQSKDLQNCLLLCGETHVRVLEKSFVSYSD